MSHCEEKIQCWIERIQGAYLTGDLTLASSLVEQALPETGDAPRLLEIAGMLAFEQGNFNSSVRLIESAMLEISLSLASQMVLAKAWLKQGDRDSAETTLRFLVEMIDRLPCSMLPDLTHALADIRRYELAISVCRTAFTRHPEDDNAVFGAAFYMRRSGYPLELVKNVMMHAVDLNPDSQLYRANVALVCCDLDLWEEAYSHTCRLPDAAIESLPCACMVAQFRKLFVRFSDHVRLDLISSL